MRECIRSLVSQADANRGKGTIEIAIVGFARIKTFVHRAEKDVCPIAEAHTGAIVEERHARKATNIRHHDRTGPIAVP